MKCSVIPLFIRIKLVHLITNGEEIITTDNHPFYVQGRGFINAGNLLVGDKLISVNGEDLFVEKHYIEETDVPVDVYNFQVEDHHTYFVGVPGDDAGHLFADQFGGSPDLDNLVSQRSDLNRAVKNTDNYRSMEREWSNALKNGQNVTDVDIKLSYKNGSSRPSSFNVSYKIDGELFRRIFKQ